MEASSRQPLRVDDIRQRWLDDPPVLPWPVPALVVETESTNADVARLAAAGAPEGTAVAAGSQTAGRGRLGRTWVAPPESSILVSVLLRPTSPAGPAWGWIPLLAGVAAATAVRRVTGCRVRLKWPNDLVVEDERGLRKLGGILLERVGEAAVVGMGINVDLAGPELPVPTASSIAAETGEPVDRETVLCAVLHELATAYAAWQGAGSDPSRSGLADAYRSACATVGAAVRVELPGGSALTGVAEGVDDSGCLVVRDADGRATRVAAGDVIHVRTR